MRALRGSTISGECGVTITDVRADDMGTWTCAASFFGTNWPHEFQDKVTLARKRK